MMLWAALALCVAAQPVPSRASFALAIGTNAAPSSQVGPLRFADDDAIANAKLTTELGAKTLLLVETDADTRALHPELQAPPPTLEAVRQAFAKLGESLKAAKADGQATELFVFYGGHGDVENGEGYVALSSGDRLWRRQLVELVREANADVTHVVVDACKSYFLALGRGPGGVRTPRSAPLVLDETELPASVGLVLSTSSASDSHEWEAYQGGIFSHEVRSALRGAADVDGDGAVTYRELQAFVWAANADIANRRFRPDVFTRAPEGATELVRLPGASTLNLGPAAAEHLYVEDANGTRLADFHLAAGQRLALVVPMGKLFLRAATRAVEWVLPENRPLRLAELLARPTQSARRGAEHQAFEKLFGRPFDVVSLELAERAETERLDGDHPRPVDLRPFRYGLGIGALLTAGAGATFTALAISQRNGVDGRTTGVERAERNGRIGTYNTAAVVFYGVAGAALASFLLWSLLPDDAPKLDWVATPTAHTFLLTGSF